MSPQILPSTGLHRPYLSTELVPEMSPVHICPRLAGYSGGTAPGVPRQPGVLGEPRVPPIEKSCPWLHGGFSAAPNLLRGPACSPLPGAGQLLSWGFPAPPPSAHPSMP